MNSLRHSLLLLPVIVFAVESASVHADSPPSPQRPQEPHPVFETSRTLRPAGPAAEASERLDELVFARLGELGIAPAPPCSDAVFLRRARLAATGTLPGEDEARDFLASSDERNRALLVEELLDSPEFADYWTMHWADILRVKSEFPINLWPNATQAYHRWIHTSIRENKPLHHFARELLVSTGSNFREGEVNFYRAMQDRSPRGIAATVALTFLGERAEHWPERKLDALAGFFANVAFKSTDEWKEEIVYFDPAGDIEGLHERAIFPDGTAAELDPDRHDPRAVFADWLLRPENSSFSRSAANRIWTWLMGRGIVHEPDDFRPGNPPSNPELLDYLENEFIASRCDRKHLIRVILNSRTFALSSLPAEDSAEAAANFAHYPLRRLEAEVLIDAINRITETTESYSSSIPEPFTFIPGDVRSIALPDGSITSSFLELFGRPPRDTGRHAERGSGIDAEQRLHLLNSSHILGKIRTSPLVDAGKDTADLRSLAEPIYLAALSRRPTGEEIAALRSHAESTGTSGRDLATDLLWALVNQPEFYFNH